MSMTIDAWSEGALAQLEEGGIRSRARRAIVEQLGAQECAVTADELSDQLAGAGHDVGRATVYRVLEQLRRLRLVQRLDLGAGAAHYEPARDEHHHHLVCEHCGRITPFADPGLERAIIRVARHARYDVSMHDVVLYGACERCSDG